MANQLSPERRATITIQSVDSPDALVLGTLYFRRDADRQGIFRLREDLCLPDNETVTIEATFVKASGNLSLAIQRLGRQSLIAMCRWTDVDPYFGVGIPGLGVLHVYLERTAVREASL